MPWVYLRLPQIRVYQVACTGHFVFSQLNLFNSVQMDSVQLVRRCGWFEVGVSSVLVDFVLTKQLNCGLAK